MVYRQSICVLLLTGLTVLGIQACSNEPQRQLDVISSLDQAPGNITVTPDKRIIVSLHQFFTPEWRVAEWTPGGLQPFPTARLATTGSAELELYSVLGIQSDSRGIVWMLDNGLRGGALPKVVAWDTRAGQLHRIIVLPEPIAPANAFVNDLAVDESRGYIYIADPAGGSNAALIVVNYDSGYARRVLQGHKSVVPEDLDLVVDGKPIQINQPDGSVLRPRIGVNPIALDVRDEWLYYGPMHATSLYRVRVEDLVDDTLTPETLASMVERYGRKPICDGIAVDRDDNIYVTDIANNAIGVIDASREYRVYLQDERLSWPDALSFGPDGRLYTVSNQLHRSALLNAGERTAEPPFYILAFEPLAPGVTGR
ncbi:MAG: L-dopachrome tautomerase-related protein [Gammaproteobacteria bacterium]|jgi:sugar lactone lactonase YvrE